MLKEGAVHTNVASTSVSIDKDSQKTSHNAIWSNIKHEQNNNREYREGFFSKLDHHSCTKKRNCSQE